LIDFLSGGGGVAEGSNIVGKALAWQTTMNRCKFVEFDLYRTHLPNFEHLPELFIANKYLVYFEYSFLEYKINWVLQYLFRI
jgi:hypothetical protein